MLKKDLRKEYKEKRRQITPKESMRLNDLLLIQFQQWPLPDILTLLNYWPIYEQQEVNTHLMADYISFRIPELRIAFPVISKTGHVFEATAVTADTAFIQNEYKIMEPADGIAIPADEIDAVFVPLLAFDLNGYRVGYGKGFYDRFLSLCRDDVIRIGFSFFEAEAHIDDINEFDVPLNVCITPSAIYEF